MGRVQSITFPRFAIAALLLALIATIACGRSIDSAVTKTQAIKEVRLLSVPGWQETISDVGRFRVLLPGVGRTDDDVISVKGCRLVAGNSKWVVNYSDFESPRASDDEHLRSAYRDSVAAITTKGGQLLLQREVRLHGRLGSEFVIAAAGTVSYMRCFLFSTRMYVLAVDRKIQGKADAAIPADVLQFFASFTYWDPA